MMNEPPLILLVEDDPNDATLIQRTIYASGHPVSIFLVTDGSHAIRYLKGEGQYADCVTFPRPRLVLLDLKLPEVDGFEVLKWIRSQPQYLDLRVVVLTSSTEIRDVNRAYKLGANSFLVKPLEVTNADAMLATFQKQQVWTATSA